jgi:flagellar P-ring protein precursor FlgI
MQRLIIILALITLISTANTVFADPRIKDIADFEGVRDNMLVGYGLVVGLNGTGDSLGSAIFTRESLIGMLERLGVNARDDSLDSKNVAAVMVTATLPPFSRQGSRIDVNISAIGDSKNLQGGTLVVTPLMGADGEVYAVAQGPVAVGGFSTDGSSGSKVVKNIPTAGRIPNGAIIEKEQAFALSQLSSFNLSLKNPDFTTSRRVAQTINAFLGNQLARALDSGTIEIQVPSSQRFDMVSLMTDIEQLRVEPDLPARIVIDERSGVIVMGENVQLSRVAIAQGNLTIRISETPQVSQPNAFSNTGDTTTVQRSNIDVDEESGNKLAIVSQSVSLQELVKGLNALGIGPRDLITILQAIKASGALQADIEVM